MKLREYIAKLQELEAIHGDLEVVYSSDDEGNSFSNVYYSPSVQFVDEECEVITEDRIQEYSPDEYKTIICVNWLKIKERKWNKEFIVEDFEDYKIASTEKLIKLYHKQQDNVRQLFTEYENARSRMIDMKQELDERFELKTK